MLIFRKIYIFRLAQQGGQPGICFVMQIIVNTFCEFANFISLCNFQRYLTGRGYGRPYASVGLGLVLGLSLSVCGHQQMLPIICTHTQRHIHKEKVTGF